jgi:flagella synthesis protein FlgN
VNRREQLLQVVEQDMQQDCIDYGDLHQVMQELYRQLLQRNCQQIDLLNEQVASLIEPLRARARRRSKILAAFGLRPGSEAMQQLFKLFPDRQCAQLQRLWGQLGQLAGQSKYLNERNGKLLAMHNDILSQLLGDSGDTRLYAPQFF